MPTVTPRQYLAQLLPQVSSAQESADAIAQGQRQFDQHHEGHADDAVEVEQEEDDEMEGMECPPQRPPTPLRGAEVRFGGAAGEVVAVGAAAAEQALAQEAQARLDLGRRGRIEHADRAARLPVAKTKTRHRAGDPVEQLALDRRGRGGQAGIERQEPILLPPQEPAKETHAAAVQGAFQLRPRETVDLDQHQARLTAGRRLARQPQQAYRPGVAAQGASHSSPDFVERHNSSGEAVVTYEGVWALGLGSWVLGLGVRILL